jgi:imidazolonepropionase
VDLFISHIAQLVTVASGGARVKKGAAMSDIGLITGAGVVVRGGVIEWAGPMGSAPNVEGLPEFDASGLVVMPGFVDSHTHMVFAGDRAAEFGLRVRGATYQEIAERGGGILSTVRQVRAATKRELKRAASRHLAGMLRHGTTTVEIKSGYGLDPASEAKMLEAISELANEEVTTIVPTFIGAHAVPPEYAGRTSEYVDLVIGTMLPYVGERKLARFCDVFCDYGYFSVDDSARILRAAREQGMELKLHADQLASLGGVRLAVELGAVSVDHLEYVSPGEIDLLAASETVATVLPGVSFTLNSDYAPARMMIDRGVGVAVASDFNPGSCMSYSMPVMMTIACTQMRMTPEEAITACTLNGAAALGMSDVVGSIEAGKRADMMILDIPDYTHLAYHFGTNHVLRTIKNGTLLEF